MQDTFNLKNKRVTVLGLGSHGGGVGVVKFLVKQGARVLLSDLKRVEDLPALGEVRDLPIALSLGAHRPDVFGADLIVRNPAVPFEAPVLVEARRRKIPIVMESTLFFSFCSSSKIVGVSGTKGKTTTALLAAKALESAGEDVAAAGNFGRSMLELLPEITPETWVVLELSSFQLEGLEPIGKSPRFAIMTSFFPDHLDRYGSMEEYARAKSHLFRYQGEGGLLLIQEDAKRRFDLVGVQSRIYTFSGGAREAVERLFKLLELPFDPAVGVQAPFRLEKVGERGGVGFINDSCATNPGAALYALDRFGQNCILITGGTDKNLDYGELSEAINERKIPVVLLSGSATGKIKEGLDKKLISGETENLSEAVGIAFSTACPPKSRPKGRGRRWVLFSPAAASFELFDDEFDRGRKFNEVVKKLCANRTTGS